MKVLGKSGERYIVLVSEQEVSIVMGFGPYAGDTFKEATRHARDLTYGSGGDFKVGAELKIVPGHRFIANVLSGVTDAKKSASAFRALADLLEQPLDALLAEPREEDREPLIRTAPEDRREPDDNEPKT